MTALESFTSSEKSVLKPQMESRTVAALYDEMYAGSGRQSGSQSKTVANPDIRQGNPSEDTRDVNQSHGETLTPHGAPRQPEAPQGSHSEQNMSDAQLQEFFDTSLNVL